MVEPETFEFLTELALNNRKAWMDQHREEFDDARRNFTGVAMTLHSYANRFDPFIADTKSKPKQSYSKLYQDPLFRSGPGPYRADVDVYANAEHPAENLGYYVHIEPGNCSAGAALFQPSKPAIVRLRKRFVEDPKALNDIAADSEFKANFPEGLVTRKPLDALPIGFDDTSPAAHYLRMIGIGCRQQIPDAVLLEDDAIDVLIDIFRAASPLVRHFD